MLESLGLTFIQAKAYLTLIQLGRAKAGEIHKNAGVARQDIYRVLEKLQEIGLIEKVVCSPIEFIPTPLSNGLTMLVERKRTELEETAKKAEKIKERIFTSNISEREVLSQQVIATIEKEVLNIKTRKAFETASQSIDYVCRCKPFINGGLELIEETKKANRRGVKGRTVVERPESSLTIPKPIQKLIQNHALELRIIDSIPFIALGIIDKKEIIFMPSPQRTTQAITYWSKNLGFAELANNYFETMWNKADPLNLHTTH